MRMEFWGVEVKPGEVLSCDPGDDKYLHLSQVALGEIQNAKENERVILNVHDGIKKIVLGALIYGKCDQFALDIMFSKPFKLSHSCTTGSVFFIGYSTVVQDADDGMVGGYDDSDSDSDDDRQAQALMRRVKENGQNEARFAKPELRKDGAKQLKPESALIDKAAAKKKPGERKPLLGKKTEEKEESSDDDDEEDDEDDVDDDDDDDEGMEGSSDDEDEPDEEEDDSDDESDEDKNQKTPTPKVESSGKKRPLPDSSTKSPGTDKKAKVTPGVAQNQGTDGAKKGGPKTSVSKEQTPSNKGQTPKAKGAVAVKESPKPNPTPGSGKKIGQHVCNTCSRNFATESALSQHNAAKHGGK